MRGKSVGKLAVAVASLALAGGCTKGQLQGESSSYLIVDSLVAGATAGGPGVLDSLVCAPTSTTPPCLDDSAFVTMQLALKDPGTSTAPNVPTTTNYITVTRYHVDYLRSDGQNTQGVSVPYSFDGAVTMTVGAGSGSSAPFTLVRLQAKDEAPLAAMVTGGTPGLSTIAQVTFYGTDQAGRSVSVVSQIGVDFSAK